MKRLSKSKSHARDAKLGRSVASGIGATLIVGVLLLGLAPTVQVAHAGPPGGSGTTTPPVYYDVWDLGEGRLLEGSKNGTMVGRSIISGHTYRYDLLNMLSGGVDLNSILGAMLIDLDVPNAPVLISSTDWIAVTATGINNLGEIVGMAQNGLGATRAYHFDAADNLFELLPGSIVAPNLNVGPKINDWGVICTPDVIENVVVFTPNGNSFVRKKFELQIAAVDTNINFNGVIIANTGGMDPTSVRIVPGTSGYTITQFPHCGFTDISDSWICGVRAASGKVKGGAIRLPVLGASTQVQLLQQGSMSNWAGAVNNQGDVLIAGSRTLYKDGVLLGIDTLIAPEDRGLWDSYNTKLPFSLSNRDLTTGFGSMGFETVGPDRVLLLTPRLP